ncbi:MAG: polyprenyl synthetase family protein [Muribaculaceae bacterium]|nr:polyprenyl synthetase family protein [Muribaculaceae bacterium]
MSTITNYSVLINRWIEEIEFPQKPVGLYEPIKYMLAGGGKRLRPTLLCAAAEAFGLAAEKVRNQALGIEMFHNFTLLHDDVMDNADVRHGVPTVHMKWNVPTAILSGDTMLTLANKLIGDAVSEAKWHILDLFNKTAIEIYEGQQYDMNFETADDVTIDEYLEMIRLKTAVLLGCACAIGAIAAGANDKAVDGMYRYGEQMGLAFQLRDDYLDTFGDPAKFGKAIGGDILNDKKTWLQINANKMTDGKLLSEAQKLSGQAKIDYVTDQYRRLGVDRECLGQIAFYTDNAVRQLNTIDNMPAEFAEYFTSLAMSAIDRQY